MQQKVVERRDGVEEDALDWRAQELDQCWNPAGLENGQEALAMMAQVVQRPYCPFRGLLLQDRDEMMMTITLDAIHGGHLPDRRSSLAP